MDVGKQSVSQYSVMSARMVLSEGVVLGSDQARNFSCQGFSEEFRRGKAL